MASRAVMFWFYRFCPYNRDSKQYKDALKRVQESSSSERNKLKAEFDEYDNGTIPVHHYSPDGEEWIATINGPPQPQQNLKGIQPHGKKWRVERRINGELYRWTFDTRGEAMEKRDRVFSGAWSPAFAQQNGPERL